MRKPNPCRLCMNGLLGMRSKRFLWLKSKRRVYSHLKNYSARNSEKLFMNPITEKIQICLENIAEEWQVKILYACESGSRAWGFPSVDSDYDVRFLYVFPQDWYLSINLEKKRDVIESMIENRFDLCGWDLRKALGLLRKSNAPLLEWLLSLSCTWKNSNTFWWVICTPSYQI